MGMLTKEDLKQIGEVMDEKLDKRFEHFEQSFEKKMDAKFVKFEERIIDRMITEVDEVFEQNFLPRVDEMIDEKLAPIQAPMVTKTYLDEKLGALKGDLIAQNRKLEAKTDVLIDTLAAHGTLESPDLERLETSRVFPRPS